MKKRVTQLYKAKKALWLLILFTPAWTFTHWLVDKDNKICHGQWYTTYPESSDWKASSFLVDLERQRFNLKEKELSGKNLSLVGKGIILEAKTTSLAYDKTKMLWSMEGDVHLQTSSLFLEAEALSFHQNEFRLEADNVHFVLLPQHLHGYAKHFHATKDSFELIDVTYTQCPPDLKIWSIDSQRITYDGDEGLLVIERPELTAYEKTLIRGPTIRVFKNRILNKMVTIPNIKFSSQGSFALRFPMFKNQKEQSIEVVPEINIKYGPGLFTKIFKENVTVSSFAQLIKTHDDPRAWFLGVKGSGREEKFIYNYEGAFISDQDLVYRYPDIAPNLDQLYAVNRASLKQETPLGMVQFYTEKLYRYQEARNADFEVIENLANLRLSNYQPDYHYQISGDLFYRYRDRSYRRFLSKATRHLNRNTLLNFKFNHYLEQEMYQASVDFAWQSPDRLLVPALRGNIVFLAKAALEEGLSPLLDTVYMPIHYESLDTLNWHHGSDWSSDGVVIGPRFEWTPQKDLNVNFAINCALKIPKQPWDSNTQPYLTTFGDDHRFSPLGIRIAYQDRFLLSSLVDVAAQKYVSGQLDYNMELSHGQGYVSLFYHHYYPQDRLSLSTDKVAQFNCGYFSKTKEPWQFFVETGLNLIPIKLERMRMGWKYDHCCWESSLGFSCQKGYDPKEGSRKWNYAVTLKAEIRALGFMQLGQEKTLRYLGIQWNKFNMNNELYHPGYH
ncbi:hypothetical protein EBR43_02560 [bacterium]|nr:hypothetical protein [bacterium]NBW56669.1 hypothetical protein [bacterium]